MSRQLPAFAEIEKGGVRCDICDLLAAPRDRRRVSLARLQAMRSMGSFQKLQTYISSPHDISISGAFHTSQRCLPALSAICAMSGRPTEISQMQKAPASIAVISGPRETAKMQSSPSCDIRELGDFWAASRSRRNERALPCDICNLSDLWVASPCNAGI